MPSANAFLYAIGTRWVVDWIVKQAPKRWSKRRAIMLAIGVLVLALSPSLIDHVNSKGENYYHLLNIPVDSTAKEIKSAYRRASLENHPDKLDPNMTPEETDAANLRFQAIREAYEALMHQATKSVYDKYGPDMLERVRHQASDSILSQALVNMAVYYVSMSVITFLMTLGHGSPLARKWSFTGLLVVLVMDVAIKFSDWSPARTLFPYATPAEKADVVKICYMSFMQGCHVLAAVTYVDQEKLMQIKLSVLEQRQRQILVELRALRQTLSGAKVVGIAQQSGSASAAPASPAAPTSTQALPTARQRKKRGGPGRSTTTAGASSSKSGSSSSGAAGAGANGAAPETPQKGKSFQVNGLVVMVALYLFYTYVIG